MMRSNSAQAALTGAGFTAAKRVNAKAMSKTTSRRLPMAGRCGANFFRGIELIFRTFLRLLLIHAETPLMYRNQVRKRVFRGQ